MTSPISDYSAALDFLFGRTDYERVPAERFRYDDLKLDRMRNLLDRIDNPQNRLPAIHLAGTKGKGSTATMIASILTAAGFRTGLFTSPHLTCIEERIRLNGCTIPAEDVVRHTRTLARVANDMRLSSPSQTPTFFELSTALAWLWFAEQQADFVVLETGLGGRLDSTNVCRPVLTMITSIGLDHTQQLGDTVEQIAAEKAGIFKPGVRAISGAVGANVKRTIRNAAGRIKVALSEMATASTVQSYAQTEAGTVWTVEVEGRVFSGLELPVVGRHQGHNLSLALAAIEFLRRQGRGISDVAIRAGLQRIELPARQEVFPGPPAVLLDSCHNAVSTAALVETISQPPFDRRRKVLLFASSRDKDVRLQLRMLGPYIDEAVLTEHERSLRTIGIEELSRIARESTEWPIECIPQAAAAFVQAQSCTGDGDLLVVAGSFYLAGEVRKILLAQKNNRQPATA